MQTKLLCIIYLSIYLLYKVYPSIYSDVWWELGYTMGSSPIYHSAYTIHTHIHTYGFRVDSCSNLHVFGPMDQIVESY